MNIAQIWFAVGLLACFFKDFTSAADCTPFAKVRKLKVRYISNRLIATFKCRKRFTLVGAKRSICIQGKWSSVPPVCVNARCDAIDPIDNGNITKTYKGAVLSFTCQVGYVLQGQQKIYCNGRKWSDKAPSCIYKEPAKQCDFETDDLCGWTQDPDDDFDWLRISGATPTDRTGPNYDHTFQTLAGHYLYIESSSPRRPGDIARLFSPVYRSIWEDACFDFYYHMKGLTGEGDVGTLAVYITEPNEGVEGLIPVFNRSGHQNPDWVRGKFAIGQQNSPFRIVISASRGLKYYSDISIDDVRIYNCSEDEMDITTQPEPTTKVEEQSTSSSVTDMLPVTDSSVSKESTSHKMTSSESFETSSVIKTTESEIDISTTIATTNKALDILTTEPTVVPTEEASHMAANTDTTIEIGFTTTSHLPEINSTVSLQPGSDSNTVPLSTSLAEETTVSTKTTTPRQGSGTDTTRLFTTSSTESEASKTDASSTAAKSDETTTIKTSDQKSTDVSSASTIELTSATSGASITIASGQSSLRPQKTEPSTMEATTVATTSTKGIPIKITTKEPTTKDKTTQETTVQTTQVKLVTQAPTLTTIAQTIKQVTMGPTTTEPVTTKSIATSKRMTSSKDLTTGPMTTVLVTSAPTTTFQKSTPESTTNMADTTIKKLTSTGYSETTAIKKVTTVSQRPATMTKISTQMVTAASTTTMSNEISDIVPSTRNDYNTTLSPSANVTDIPNVIKVDIPVKPLMIGIGVGVAIGLVVVIVIVFIYFKKKRAKTEEFEDEMAPIAKNAYSEW